MKVMKAVDFMWYLRPWPTVTIWRMIWDPDAYRAPCCLQVEAIHGTEFELGIAANTLRVSQKNTSPEFIVLSSSPSL